MYHKYGLVKIYLEHYFSDTPYR